VAHGEPQAIGRGFEDLGLQRHAVAQVGDHHDGDVEFAAHKQMLEIAAIVLDRRNLDAGAGAAVAGEQIGEHIAGNQRGDADVELARQFVLAAGKACTGVGNARENLGRMAQELVAVMGDRQPARVAVEELDAEIGFQFLQRLRNRGLRDRQVLRGPRDRALLGHRDEILDLAKREGHVTLEHGGRRYCKHAPAGPFLG
jgi:hypothetical protein